MKQKITLCCLLLLFAATGCFSVTEWLLGCTVEPKEKEKGAPGSVTFTQGPRYNVEYYQYQYWPPRWWYRWWVDTGGRCWWLDYNVDPVYWPRPKLKPRPRVEHPPRVRNPISKRRTMIPRDTKSGIDRYVDHGVPTGSFLRAVLSNDLFEAVAKADYHNKLALVAICEYIYNYTPHPCHGSPEEVAAWLKFHREKPERAHEAAGGDRERRERYYDQESRK